MPRPDVWTPEDQRRALMHGWGLFRTQSAAGRWRIEIQRNDATGPNAERFATDTEARAFVYARAVAGDALARRALRQVYPRRRFRPSRVPTHE